MSKTLAMTFACSYLSFTATFAIAADQPDKAVAKPNFDFATLDDV